MNDSNGQEFIEWYSMAQGALHDAMAHITGVKSLAWIGLSKTTGLNIAAKWLDDLDLSNDDMRAIIGGSAGTVLGSAGAGGLVALAGFTGPAAPIVIAAGGVLGGIGGDLFGEKSDEIYEFARSRVLDYFDADDANPIGPGGLTASPFPNIFGRMPFFAPSKPLGFGGAQVGVTAPQVGEPLSFPPPVGSVIASSNPLSDFLSSMPLSKPSTPLGFGNVRGSTAAPSLGEPLSFPLGSPGYPPSSAQRMKALQ